MALYIMAGIIPAIFLVEIGQAFRPGDEQPTETESWTGYLLASLLILSASIQILYNLGEQISAFLLLLLPAALAAFAQNVLWLVRTRLQDVLHSRKLLAVLLANLVVLGTFIPTTDLFIGGIVLIGGSLLALTCGLWERAGRAWIAIYALVLLLGLYSGWRFDANRDLFSLRWLGQAESLLAYFILMLEVLALFMLLAWALRAEDRPSEERFAQTGRQTRTARVAWAGLLALPVLGLLGWQIATSAAWDVATDGLGGIATLQLSGTAGIAAAVLVAWRLPASRRVAAFGLALVLPLYMLAMMSFGTYGFEGGWGKVPLARTERRAASIEQAIQRYYQRNGNYPSALDELTPAYLLLIPNPFIIPGQDWCYQGGPDFYRLGFVYREFFSTPAMVRVYSASGQPPVSDWPCETEAARYPGPAGFYDQEP